MQLQLPRVAHRALTAIAMAGAVTFATSSLAQTARLVQVANFEDQVTGVAVSESGRIFVNFPRWNADVAISVAEVANDGSIRPFPNAEWNRWRNANKNQVTPGDHFVCVQSVVADGRGGLWVVDPGAPNSERIVPGAPKLVKIDLGTNSVARVIPFDETVAPQGSYLNDVRFTPDGRHAFMTDSGARGAIVVVDLQSGRARRVLDGHPSTQVERDIIVMIEGKPLRRPDGRQPEFASDSIAITPDGTWLYWQALTGKTLYRIRTSMLTDPQVAASRLAGGIERVAENRVADGILFDRRGRLYLTAPEQNALRIREGDGAITTLVEDARLRWPDSLAEGPDGTIYVTASRIQDNGWFKPASSPHLRTQLFRLSPP